MHICSQAAKLPSVYGRGTGGMLHGKGSLLLRWFSEWHGNVSTINQDNKKGLIFELELAAVLMGLRTLCASIRNADVVVFCDNEAVVGALVCGRSDIPIASEWPESIFSIEEKQDLCVWFERVPSESNPADDPSRGVTKRLPDSIRFSANLPSPQVQFKGSWCPYGKNGVSERLWRISGVTTW